ncbi:winged helix-turn-helix domain-containing protein [Reinekea marinisedimentorum]|uniref:DNA-binding winged helix-turn-helix (WHTH) protein n=1 Tax=Reinekea marinisedimentorum TaxID=230495 RepID=A0A4R3I7T8_9GAMM|nr:transcriptional regulator [Reinekea marinisedimentorum]TCS40201.1 DNA-binding winged helix-turn-helix (wHTH) protein [Reinekea marinisedimentorum]
MKTKFSDKTYLDFKISNKFLFSGNTHVLEQLSDHVKQPLGTNEANLLRLFMQSPGQVLSRAEIHKHVWEDNGFQVDDSSLTQAIFNLRKLLGDSSKAPAYIQTVPRQGYKFIAAVEAVEPGRADELPQAVAEPQTVEAPSAVEAVDTGHDAPGVESRAEEHPKSFSLYAALFVLGCLLLPVVFYFVTTPEKPNYTTINQIEGIAIKTPDGMAPDEKWNAAIERCVMRFSLADPVPSEVIINGGKLQRLSMNFVFSLDQSNFNQTIRLTGNEIADYSYCQPQGELNE